MAPSIMTTMMKSPTHDDSSDFVICSSLKIVSGMKIVIIILPLAHPGEAAINPNQADVVLHLGLFTADWHIVMGVRSCLGLCIHSSACP